MGMLMFVYITWLVIDMLSVVIQYFGFDPLLFVFFVFQMLT